MPDPRKSNRQHVPHSIRRPMSPFVKLLLIGLAAGTVVAAALVVVHLLPKRAPATKPERGTSGRPVRRPADGDEPPPTATAVQAEPTGSKPGGEQAEVAQKLLAEAREHEEAGRIAQACQVYRQASAQDPTCVDAWLGAAATYEKAREMEEAWRSYERAEGRVGEDRERLHRAFAAFALRCGKPEVALAQANRVFPTLPNDAEAHVTAARALLALGRGTTALKHAEIALKESPDSLPAQLAAGRALAAVARPKEAVRALKKVLERIPGSPEAGLALARVYRQLGDTAAAQQALARVEMGNREIRLVEVPIGEGAKLPPSAVNSAEAMAAMAKAETAELLLNAGKMPEAIATFEKLTKTHPELHSLQNRLAELTLLAGKPEEARTLAEKQLKRHPGDAGAHVVLARVFLRKRLLGLAEEHCQRALREPVGTTAEAGATKLLAIVRNRSGKPNEAIIQMEAYLKLRPRDLDAILRLSAYYAANDSVERGLALLTETAKAFPDAPQVEAQKALLLQRVGEPERAFAALQVAVRLGAKDYRVYLQLAARLARQEDGKKEALIMAQEARKRAPRQPLVADTLGWCLILNDRPGEAMELLTYAVQAAPQAPRYRYHLAVALSRGSKPKEAMDMLRRALASKRQFPEREDAEKLLASLAGNE